MKVIRKPIEMIAWFTEDGIPTPIKFRIKDNKELWKIVKVKNILRRETKKLAGNKMIVFTCQSLINGTEKLYEIKYELDTCKWLLFKM